MGKKFSGEDCVWWFVYRLSNGLVMYREQLRKGSGAKDPYLMKLMCLQSSSEINRFIPLKSICLSCYRY